MRVLVCGGRDYEDYEAVVKELDTLHKKWNIVTLIHGGARGADRLAGAWATMVGVQEVVCPANWSKFGKKAGVERNYSMLSLEPDAVVAFPGGVGTVHMVRIAEKAGVTVRKVGGW